MEWGHKPDRTTDQVLWYGDNYCVNVSAGWFGAFFFKDGTYSILGSFRSLEQAKHFVEMHYAVGAS